MRLPDGRLGPECVHRRWAYLAHRLLALERLQRPFYIGRDSDLLGRLVSGGFRGLIWWQCSGSSKSTPRSGSGVASVPLSTAGECCVLAASGGRW